MTEQCSLRFVSNACSGYIASRIDRGLGVVAVRILLLMADAKPVIVRDECALRGDGYEVRGDGVWFAQHCETPFEHWSYGLEAFAVRLDSPLDSLRGEMGERLPLGFELDWEATDRNARIPFRKQAVAQPGRLRGDVLIDGGTVRIDAAAVHVVDADSSVGEGEVWLQGDAATMMWADDTQYRWSDQGLVITPSALQFPPDSDGLTLPISDLGAARVTGAQAIIELVDESRGVIRTHARLVGESSDGTPLSGWSVGPLSQ
jgi:hypothetical protein